MTIDQTKSHPPKHKNLPSQFAALPGHRVAVIDIGSNSMRLVVFHDLVRTPLTLFNEKITCQLGHSLQHTGRLNPDGVRMALPRLQRFKQIITALAVSEVIVVATAAVREASDGKDFVAEITQRTGWPVKILSGQEEAELVAQGLIAADPEADGIVGDLGGGSLELINIHLAGGKKPTPQILAQTTLKLGLLRLRDQTMGKLVEAEKLFDAELKTAASLLASPRKSGKFYAIGGAWRSIARLLMDHEKYRLRVIHHYRCQASQALDFLSFLRQLSPSQLANMPNLDSSRAALTPLAALALERMLLWCGAEEVVFSTSGLREGCLYHILPPSAQQNDPILTACQSLVTTRRFAMDSHDIFQFMAEIFASQGSHVTRLAQAAAILSDIGWTEHPDDRSEISWRRVLYMPMIGITHAERNFLARAIYARYRGNAPIPSHLESLAPNLGAEWRKLAVQIGMALALAHRLSGGDPVLLAEARLRMTGGVLELSLPHAHAEMGGKSLLSYLQNLADSLGFSANLRCLP
ncbi:MAG: Ppx/GppA family phosphatase [Alphaproteobacteria bacterium]|nr:Ppx/GppA family phosphatase [Alphaproteobacteria bacterium]